MKNYIEKNMLTKDFTNCDAYDLAIKCISLSLIEGFDKVEFYIKNTFCRKESDKIILIINTIMQCKFRN